MNMLQLPSGPLIAVSSLKANDWRLLSQLRDPLEVPEEEELEQAEPVDGGASANHCEHAMPLPPNISAGLMCSNTEPAPIAVPLAESFDRAAAGNEYL